MVYESDFYTSRRPYSSSRPTVTSYSVTGGLRLPGLGKGQTFHRGIPTIGHKRLVILSPSSVLHSTRSRPSALISEYDRIYHRVRPSVAYQPTEDYLNSRSYVSFDDETRSIRAQTADLLKRIHTPVPRAQRPLPLPGDAYYSHSELPITNRITSDNYIEQLLSGNRNVARDINIMSHYDEPARRCNNIGQGHLACISYAGGRAIPRRHNLAGDESHVRQDIKVLSHTGRLRALANAAAIQPTEPAYEPSLHRPPTRSTVTGSWKSNAPRNPKESCNNLSAGKDFDAAQDRKQSRRQAIEAAAQREVDEEKRRKQGVVRQDELAQQAIVEREKELERKAREGEEAAQRKQEEDRQEAERLAQEEDERLLREEEDRLAAEEELLLQEEEARKKQEEDEKKAKKAKKEADKKAKEEAERKAKEEEEKLAQDEAERKAKEEEEKRLKEEAERKAREEEEKRVQEEAERKAKEEEEKRAQEEAERAAKEEAERLAAAALAAEVAAEESIPAEPAEDSPQVSAEATAEEVVDVPEPAEPAVETDGPVIEEPADEPAVAEVLQPESVDEDPAEEDEE